MAFAKELRASVLQAAMQGKLTDQLETDTPVSELLSKMNIKPKYNDDGIAPDSWQWVEMQDIVKLEKGEKTENKRLPYLEARYLRTGNDAKMYTNGEFVAKGTNVILVDGENSGEVFLVPEDGYMGSTFKVLSINKEMDKDFILKVLLFYKDMFRQSKKGSAIPHLNKKLFKELMIAVPPIEEQRRIVQRIEEIMKHIDELEAIEEELKKLKEVFPADMKAAVLQAAMQGKLTEQLETDSSVDDLLEDIKKEREKLIAEGKIKKSRTAQNDNFVQFNDGEEPFEIPDNWRWVKLGDIGYTNIGLTYSPKDISNDGTIVLRSSNIQNDKMDYNDIVKVKCDIPENKKCEKGDILICARNGSKKLVGKSAIIDKDGMSFGAFMALFRSQYNSYIVYVINSPYFRNSLLGDANTMTINQITQDMLKNFVLPLPPLEEQNRIVAKLEQILPLISDLS